MKKVLVPLADGVEEIEAVIIVDILRRAAWQVAAVTIAEDIVEGSRGIKLCADCKWPEIDPDDYDMIVLAGGMQGATNLAADPRILRTIRNFADAGKVVGAICAGPLVLQTAGILAKRKVTCHPSLKDELRDVQWSDARVVTDLNIVTSQGPATTFEFALELIRLAGETDTASEITEAIIMK